MGQKTLYIDYSKCIGCETCEAVCKFTYDVPRIHMTRTVDGVMAPLYCHHCERPHCLKVCKQGAITQESDGSIVLRPMYCRGCETKQCILACPYSALFATDTGAMVTKCDMCRDRRDKGMEPACVEMCPCGAILLVDRSELPGLETEESRKALEKVLGHIRPALGKK